MLTEKAIHNLLIVFCRLAMAILILIALYSLHVQEPLFAGLSFLLAGIMGGLMVWLFEMDVKK
jgi:hypothetical protein